MKTFFSAFRIFLILTFLTGVLYPLAVTEFAQALFPYQANGSLAKKDGQLIGSVLIAQKFQDAKYFWSRPSAADFATVPSGASNQGPTSAALRDIVLARAETFRKVHHLNPETPLPADLIFASGSGLDPHISPEAAYLQISRVATTRRMSEEQLLNVVKSNTEAPQFGIFGKPRVNIFRLNLALDSL